MDEGIVSQNDSRKSRLPFANLSPLFLGFRKGEVPPRDGENR